MQGIVYKTIKNKLQWNLIKTQTFSIHENPSENIACDMAAILSRGYELSKSKQQWGKLVKTDTIICFFIFSR